ncbi:g8740 [Coccomyxa viridis]|uniref:G8740 protein n=1 Tax=Coccomyxa viridis TaxID=1274662 RepID=A0ABP1G7V3_9CHLO
MRAVLALTALLCISGAAAQANAPLIQGESGGWRQGRATFYGGPERFLQNFADRGPPPEYGFGNAIFGSCGYTQQNYTEGVTYANVPYPKEALAALANIDEDFPGSCGRCYEVRCKNGLVLSNGTSIFNTTQGYNLPAHAPNATDDYNRTWLGNPTEALQEQSVLCWNTSSIFVVITDNCPCIQTNVTTGEVNGVNPPCCGDVYHMDLSYWGFQQLAHPLNGIMMTEFRPVSCDTHEPLQFNPGFINSTIYGDKVETGWAWFPYKQNTDNFWLPGAGIGGSNATCVELGPKAGGLTLASRQAQKAGYQPFGKASAVQFWLKDKNGSSTIPDLSVSVGDYDDKKYCSAVKISSLTPVQKQGTYAQFSIPITSFQCPFPATQITQIGFQNSDGQLVSFCLDEIVLVGGGNGSGKVSSSSVP